MEKRLRKVDVGLASDVLRPEVTEFDGVWIFKRAKAKWRFLSREEVAPATGKERSGTELRGRRPGCFRSVPHSRIEFCGTGRRNVVNLESV